MGVAGLLTGSAASDRLVDRMLGYDEHPPTRVRVVRDLVVPMRDGVRLLADRYRPARFGALPVVMMRTPYGKSGLASTVFARALARRGFQVVVQDARGVFGSEGAFDAFHQERADGLATAEWLRAQPWCDGRLATVGPSYLGFTQWAVGPYLDPPLEAMCPTVTASEFVSSFYPGGVLALHNMLTWSTALGTQEGTSLKGRLANLLSPRLAARAMWTLPVGEADLAAIGEPQRFLRDVTAHAEPGDDFWAPTDHSAAITSMVTPTSMVTGWWDLFLPAQLRDFRALNDAGRQTRITIGPWAHDVGIMKTMVIDQVSWLRAHLDGDTAEQHRAPVRLYLQNANQWLDFDQWPPAASKPTPMYLAPAGQLAWTPVAEGGEPDTFTYDPADPTPTVGGPLLPPGSVKQQVNGVIEERSDVLMFTGAPLRADLDLIGPVAASVWVRTDTGHADVFVRLSDVDRTGVSRNVTDGILRLRPESPAGDESGIVRADIELQPTGYRFPRGHRLRVQISGGAFPRYARNHGTGVPVAEAARSRPTRFEIFHDDQHPTALTLPVI